jgi:hypothetical protein
MKAFPWILFGVLLLAGCHAQDPAMCQTSDDCFQGELCRYERCVVMVAGAPAQTSTGSTSGAQTQTTRDRPPSPHTVAMEQDPPSEQTSPAVSQTSPPPETIDEPDEEEQPEVPQFGVAPPTREEESEATIAETCGDKPRVGDLIINEVMVNVPQEIAGDANADGARDAYEDEFVELINISSSPLDLAGVQIASNEKPKLTFAPGTCLEPFGAIVVFGGPSGAPAERWGDVLVLRSSARFGFSNSAGSVQVLSQVGATLFAFVYENPPMASYVLEPELYGQHFVSHEVRGALYSPGLCADGAPLRTGCETED